MAVDRPRDLLFEALPVEIPELDFPLEPCVGLQDSSGRRELRAEFRANGETLFNLKIKNMSNVNINTYRNMYFSPKHIKLLGPSEYTRKSITYSCKRLEYEMNLPLVYQTHLSANSIYFVCGFSCSRYCKLA